ncbi:MAG: DUF58 domain-containing protein [Acidimicrobiia bacterium]|nr:DUF58 domain-containing protein [Acidimicrobiia bacterium]
MITARGWTLLVGAAGLWVAGRMLGAVDLYVLGTGAAAVVGLATLLARLPGPRLEVRRELHPPRVYAGTESRVELIVRNAGSRRTPVFGLRDPFDGGRRQARFLVSPLAPGETARAAYRLPTERRGIFTLGPLEASVTDPFGLAARTLRVAPPSELTVYPHIDQIAPLPHTRGDDPLSGADHPTGVALSGEDFYALRAYEVGDDLRRVHWPSTARLDELMIRQNEMPWQARVTVLLDVRHRAHAGDSLELGVSAAASIVAACWQRGSLVRLVTTDGIDSGYGAAHAHVEAIMERLASVGPTRDDRFTGVLGSLTKPGNAGGFVALFTGEAPAKEVQNVARLQWRFASLTVVLFDRSAYDPTAAARGHRQTAPATGSLVRVDSTTSFAPAWNQAFGGRSVVARGALA